MIRGDGKNLTDQQWLTLMGIVSDNQPIELTMPSESGESAVLVREGRCWWVHPDGTTHYQDAPAQP